MNRSCLKLKYFAQTIRTLKERANKAVKPGNTLTLDGAPYIVVKIIQGKRGKGGGFVRGTLKGLTAQKNMFEKTWNSDDMVEIAEMEREKGQYSWKDESNDSYVFLNTITYEEISIPEDVIIDSDLLLEGVEVKLLKYNNEYIGMTLPTSVDYKVVNIDLAGLNGKEVPATLESGAKIMVPDFIEVGTKIKVNTESRTYISKC